jgi:hypothetical protein
LGRARVFPIPSGTILENEGLKQNAFRVSLTFPEEHNAFLLRMKEECFDPGRMEKFGKKHGIIISRFAKYTGVNSLHKF